MSAQLFKSVCPYCGVGCGLVLNVKDGKVISVKPQKNHPVSKGELCIKGVTIDKVINHKGRLTKPLIRKNSDRENEFVEASWKQAIDKVVQEFKRIKETYGTNALAVFSSSKCTNEENYAIQKFARVVLGTNNIDNCTRLCHAPSLAGLYESLKNSAMSNSYEDLPKSDFILIIGCNPACTQPIGFHRLLEAKQHAGRIVVVDVRKSETAKQSDKYIQIRPGTDGIFVAGMIKHIVEQGLENKEFIEKNLKGYEELKQFLNKYSFDEISKVSGVCVDDIKQTAEDYARAEKATIVYGMGITQKTIGTEEVLALTNLALVTGHIGKAGCGINPLRGCYNVQGCCDMGCLPNMYPGYAHITEDSIKKFEKLWNVKNLPIENGLTACEIIDAVPETVLGIYIIGENPVVSHPDVNSVEGNLKNLEFLVVQDVFLTQTAELADVVLPAACFAEKTGTVTNTERRVQMINKAVDPPGEAKTDLDIVLALADKFGFGKFFRYKNPRDVFKEIRNAVPQYSKMTYTNIMSRTIQWPCDKENPNGTKILYQKGLGRRAVLYPMAMPQEPEKNYKEKYPFVLIPHRTLEHYNAGSFTTRVQSLNRIQSNAFIEINEHDAKELGLKNREIVNVVSEHGNIKARVKISKDMQRGVVGMENHFPETRVNRLTSPQLDPVSKIPEFKNCRIEKIK